MSTPLGTYRHLLQSSTSAGHFVILAIDHRANLKAALDAVAPAPLDEVAFADFKMAVLAPLMPIASAVLIDPAYGIARGIAQGTISGQHGILAPLEVTDYDVHPSQRELQFIDGWSVEKIKRAGGSGVKLLLNYHPDAASAPEKIALVKDIVAQCRAHQIPFFLEPIAYALSPDQKLSSEEKQRVVIDSAATFSQLGVDVLKVEFPALPDDPEAVWQDALAGLDAACGAVPWALLSAGVDYETFQRQAEMACQAGASGVIVGRAVWAEAVTLQGAERIHFLQTTARQRIDTLATICAELAHDWRQRVAPPSIEFDWYKDK